MNKHNILLVLMTLPAFLYAQEVHTYKNKLRHEVSLGIGFTTEPRNSSFKDFYYNRHTIEDIGYGGNFDPAYSLHLQYFYNFSQKIAIGVTFGYYNESTQTFGFGIDENGDRNSNGLFHFDSKVAYAMPLVRLSWISANKYAFYTKFGAGLW